MGASSAPSVSAVAATSIPPSAAVSAARVTIVLRSVRLLFKSILAVGSRADGRSRFPGAPAGPRPWLGREGSARPSGILDPPGFSPDGPEGSTTCPLSRFLVRATARGQNPGHAKDRCLRDRCG
ncbi:hypothetical protein GCM10023096_04260 [Nonomuraea ferruginea]